VTIVSSATKPRAQGPPPFGCPRVLVLHIRGYPPNLEAITSVRKVCHNMSDYDIGRSGSHHGNAVCITWHAGYKTRDSLFLSKIPETPALPTGSLEWEATPSQLAVGWVH